MALHFDPIRVAQELEAEGFEHRQAVAIVNMIRDHVIASVAAGRDDDTDATVAAINETRRHLEGKVDVVRVEVAAVRQEAAEFRAEVRSEFRDLRHEMAIAIRDGIDRAGTRAETAAARTTMWIGFATVFLGLMIGASAILPAVVALFK